MLGGTLASACFFVSQGLTHKDRLFAMLRAAPGGGRGGNDRDEAMYNDTGRSRAEATAAREEIQDHVPETHLLLLSENDSSVDSNASAVKSIHDAALL